jgi:hypothetical protein
MVYHVEGTGNLNGFKGIKRLIELLSDYDPVLNKTKGKR